MTRSARPAPAQDAQRLDELEARRRAVRATMSPMSRHRTGASAAASMPSVNPATISPRSCPAARWRAGVKNISR